ncbi:MAG TPA: PEP-CTERM sorting domain-containing protein [Armatimonadota bacterium]|nr:PEP-CTERM sorting domain-containing protein [Armatimonadota bacterium]
MGGFAAWAASVPPTLDYYVEATGPGPGAYFGTLISQAIPEPSSLLALGGGLMGLGGLLLRRRK